jgi:hypothetical protein
MASLKDDLYFNNIPIAPIWVNAMVCKHWYINIIAILQKKKLEFYELQIYNLIVNKYSNHPPYGYNTKRRLEFDGSNGCNGNNGCNGSNIYEDNIFNIAYDNMIRNIFEYLKNDTKVFQGIKESLILYYTKYMALHARCCRLVMLDILCNEYIDADIANEYKQILLKYYNHDIV